MSLIESFSSSLNIVSAMGAATSFIAPASPSRTSIANPNIIPSIIHDAWRDNCAVIGPKGATVAVDHYTGCLGLSDGEAWWLGDVNAISKTGAPVALIVPDMHAIVRTTPKIQKEQLSSLMGVFAGFTDEQKRFLPKNTITNRAMAAVGSLYKRRIEGAQLWHDLVFATEETTGEKTDKKIVKTTLDRKATAPLLLKAGEEVTGIVAEARRGSGIDHFVSSGWSLGGGMAGYEALFGDEAPLGVMAGTTLLPEVFALRPMVRNYVRGVIVADENDPIPSVALNQTVEGLEALKKDWGLTNLNIERIKGKGHFWDCDRMSTHLATILNTNMRYWAPAYNN